MPIKWKKHGAFQPSVILERIDAFRTVNPSGGPSFSGFELEECLPTLHSMLSFPASAAEVDRSTLVWRGLARVGKELTAESFLVAINQELNDQLATREQTYNLLTEVSLHSDDLPKRITVSGVEIRMLSGNFPDRFRSRRTVLGQHHLPIPDTPPHYCKVVVRVKGKSPAGAVNKALQALDLQRAFWCLMGNPRMQFFLGGTPALSPINVARLGSRHTLHLQSGVSAGDQIWFDPSFIPAKTFRISRPAVVGRNTRWALRQIASCPYGESLKSSLIRFVRALDEGDANVAFLRLWGALEALTTPGQADYQKIVKRCSFLFRDETYHTQVLEHLRDYRNVSVHAGEESDRARTHCYQLQLYFVNLVWFHIRNARYFQSLDEANAFLDLPSNATSLKRRLALARKAVRFIA